MDKKELADFLMHYGTPRHSGRYPWGSGKNPQRSRGTAARIKELKEKGFKTQAEIAKALGMSINEMKAKVSYESEKARMAEDAAVFRLKEKGWSTAAISKKLNMPYTTVATKLKNKDKTVEKAKKESLSAVTDVLKESIAEGKYIDVGRGVNRHLGITESKLTNARKQLVEEGYVEMNVQIPQPFGKNYTTMKVLAAPGTTKKEIFDNYTEVKFPFKYSQDGGKTFVKKQPIVNIDSKRVFVRYNEDGGIEKDGLIELRRGVEDMNLGSARYAQVRIGVDGTHYMKGMAVYGDVPDGYDVVYNTNKHRGAPFEKVFKAQKTLKNGKVDPENPFGASIKDEESLEMINRYYTGKDGKTHQSALNIVNEEGTWSTWSKKIAAQMLSKQDPMVAKKQLKITADIKKEQFEEIMRLNNPLIKKKMLEDFADECDSDAVYLKSAGFPRQQSHVILPFPKMKETEVYAPNYENGEEVVLIRYPHAGIFEIPRLRVNNNVKAAKETIGNAKDAIGIHPKVAEQLSGADFDGDTVVVIPTRSAKIKTKSPLEGLKNFDTKEAYPNDGTFKPMNHRTHGIEMGKITNLITDMNIQKATDAEMVRAVKHSMVIVDAEKHKLNYKQSYIDNGIDELKKKYQGDKSVATLLSAAKNPIQVPKRLTYYKIDPKTGEKIFTESGDAHYTDYKTGKQKTRTQESSRMYEAKDAHELSSGTRIEEVYADYANEMKSLGNKARLESTRTAKWEVSKDAAIKYAPEVESLKKKLTLAESNAPIERKAIAITNKKVAEYKENNPQADKDDVKKFTSKALATSRAEMGAHKEQIVPTDKEWEAIQAHAINKSTMENIIKQMDSDRMKELATPRESKTVSASMQTKIRQLSNAGYTQSEIANYLDISTATVNQYARKE